MVGEEGGTSPLHNHSNFTSSWLLFKCQMTTSPFILLLCYFHRVYRVPRLSLQSFELAPPAPSPASKCCPPLWFQGGGTHSLAGSGRGKPIRTKGQTLWYSRYGKIPLRLFLSWLFLIEYFLWSVWVREDDWGVGTAGPALLAPPHRHPGQQAQGRGRIVRRRNIKNAA